MIKVGSIVTRKGKGPTRFVVLSVGETSLKHGVYRCCFESDPAGKRVDFLLWADDIEVQS